MVKQLFKRDRRSGKWKQTSRKLVGLAQVVEGVLSKKSGKGCGGLGDSRLKSWWGQKFTNKNIKKQKQKERKHRKLNKPTFLAMRKRTLNIGFEIPNQVLWGFNLSFIQTVSHLSVWPWITTCQRKSLISWSGMLFFILTICYKFAIEEIQVQLPLRKQH